MYHSQYIIDIRLIIHRDITLENYSRLYYKVKRKNKKEEKLRTKYRCDDGDSYEDLHRTHKNMGGFRI